MELTQSTGTVYGARYYTLKPGFFAPWKEIISWCVQSFGPVVGSIWADEEWVDGKAPGPGGRWYLNGGKIWFREKDDMAYFILRWS
jgi:hypothetical protein